MVEFQEARLAEPGNEPTPEAFRAGEIVIGTVVKISPHGQPLVSYPGSVSHGLLPALTTQAITCHQVGRQVALLFSEGDPQKPVIMGLIYHPLAAMLDDFQQVQPGHAEHEQESGHEHKEDTAATVKERVSSALVDGEKVVIEGSREIVLKCGEASITLTAAGKVLIKGKYVLSRSSGVNRIQGGSVQVN